MKLNIWSTKSSGTIQVLHLKASLFVVVVVREKKFNRSFMSVFLVKVTEIGWCSSVSSLSSMFYCCKLCTKLHFHHFIMFQNLIPVSITHNNPPKDVVT